MPGLWDNVPITHAIGADGRLHYVDDVPRGDACGCFCPDPLCGQPMRAKQGDVYAHHFAHVGGSQDCQWAAENVISEIAVDIIRNAGSMVFPDLTCEDPRCGTVCLAQSRAISISSVELVSISGRRNPDLAIKCNADTGNERRFLAVLCLTHTVDKYLGGVLASSLDAFVVDFRKLFDQRKREAGRHYKREEILEEFQDPRFLESVLVTGDGYGMKWLYNAKSAAESQKRHEEYLVWREEEKRRKEQEAKEEAERQARLEKERAERRSAEAKARAEREAAEAKFEEGLRAEEERRTRIRDAIAPLVKDHFKPAIDSDGNRWAKCILCGEYKQASDFDTIGISGSENLGKCNACMHPQRLY